MQFARWRNPAKLLPGNWYHCMGLLGDDVAATANGPLPELRFYLPAEPLRDLVTSYYVIACAGPLRDWVYPENGNVRFALSGEWAVYVEGVDARVSQVAGLYGPTDRASEVSTDGGAFIGVGLTPLGWVRLIGGAASAMVNRIVPLGDELGIDGGVLAAGLRGDADDAARVARLDAVLTARVAPPSRSDALIAAVTQALADTGDCDVATFAAAIGVSERILHRICLMAFGFTPKHLLMRQRFFRTLGRVRDRLDQPLTDLLGDGYYDQSHFIRDFRAYMGMTPSAYYALPREVIRRAAAERQRVVGAPMQGLHSAG